MLLVGLLLLATILALLLIASWKSKCLLPVVVALIVQITLASIILNSVGFQGDAGGYFAQATEIHDQWAQGQIASNPKTLGKMSILWLIAGLYLLTGPNVAFALVLLSTLVAFVPLLVCLATRDFGFDRASTLAAWLGALSPPILFWGSWIQRESLTFPILALALWGISRVYRGAILSGAGIACCSVGLLVISRPQLIVPVAVGLVAAQLLSRCKTPGVYLGRALGVSLLSVCMMVVFLWTPSSESVTDADRRQAEMRSNANSSQNTAVTSATTSSATVTVTPPLASPMEIELPTEVVSRLPSAMFGPFPNQWRDRSWTVIGLDGLAWLLLTLGAIYLVVRHRDTRRMTAICSATAIIVFLGLALMLSNYGLAMRIRAHAWIVMIPVAAVMLFKFVNACRFGKHKLEEAPNGAVTCPSVSGLSNAETFSRSDQK